MVWVSPVDHVTVLRESTSKVLSATGQTPFSKRDTGVVCARNFSLILNTPTPSPAMPLQKGVRTERQWQRE